MSQSSFPRKEHIEILRDRIARRAQTDHPACEIEDQGADRFRCRYRFALRRAPGEPPRELAIHFQVAERLLAGGGDAELIRLVDAALKKLGKKLGGAPENTGQGVFNGSNYPSD